MLGMFVPVKGAARIWEFDLQPQSTAQTRPATRKEEAMTRMEKEAA